MIQAEIIDVGLDDNGNIFVLTDYKDEHGNLIQRGTTRYSFFATPTEEELHARIRQEITDHCNALIVRQYFKKQNALNWTNVKVAMVGQKINLTQGTHIAGGLKRTVDKTGIISTEVL